MAEASKTNTDDAVTDSPPLEKNATPQTNGDLTNGTHPESAEQDGASEPAPPPAENVFQLTVQLPHAPWQTQLMVSAQEQVQDIRQSIIDTPQTSQYSCFHLEHRGKRINDFVELSELPEIAKDPECRLVEDPYTEAQARMHIVRTRELIGAAGNRTDLVLGADAGKTLCDDIGTYDSQQDKTSAQETTPVANYDLDAPGSISILAAKQLSPAPKTVKSLALSSWNPPPYQLRMRGHLLYLQITTLEGEQFYVSSTVSGFYVNKSSNQKFDPAPRASPKAYSAHSLMTLLSEISPSFDAAFKTLQEYNGQRDPLASYQPSNTLPAAPWLVPLASVQQHQPDIVRTQESYLLAGADNADTLRDWNEEFQSTRELPKETVQDRVFRERLTGKLFAEYTEAAVRGAILVARGEVQPLNPTEAREAQIFVYNNVFYSFGADGVGTFTSDGGDEAARVATGKDVQGVRALNQLDITGLFTAGTVVVDYLGKRIVGQSIVPGIFKQREPGEHQIDYGGVEGKDVVATLESFVKPFAELSKATRAKRHAVWDKEGKVHELEASVETKGLLGTDGRKYALDLYRLTPLDINWLEKYREDYADEQARYPHRMAVLRPELVESYRIMKLREYISNELKERQASKTEAPATNGVEQANGTSEIAAETPHTNGETTSQEAAPEINGESDSTSNDIAQTTPPAQPQQTVDVSAFSFALNPDVFAGQQPQTDAEKTALEADEAQVRTVCTYLESDMLPRIVQEIREGDAAFPMDGQSLVREMHKRGINVRYLGEVARLSAEHAQNASDKRCRALEQLCQQEMVARAFKHFANAQMKSLPPCFAQSCLAHLLNCLLGGEVNAQPKAEVDAGLMTVYADVDLAFEKVSPESMVVELRRQVELRFRAKIEGDLIRPGRQLQMLREVSLKLGLQLEAKDYQFTKDAQAPLAATLEQAPSDESLSVPHVNGHVNGNGTHSSSEGGKKKKKKQHADTSPARVAAGTASVAPATFRPENVLNLVPVVKEAAPRSVLAEEALDAGRMGLQQDQKDLGQELLFESLSLHEQIYGILHPEVARVYYALSSLYFNLDEKSAAIELAKKAVIISERTMGVDNAETIMAYLNLSMLEHGSGNTMNALAYVKHALDLQKIVYGPRHPDSLTTLNNIAIMLQLQKRYAESRLWFERAVEMCDDVQQSISNSAAERSNGTSPRPAQATGYANLLFQFAQSLAFNQEPKLAMARMREAYSIFKSELGPDHPNTKEAEHLLDILTNMAVSQAKQAASINTSALQSSQNRRLLLSSSAAGRKPVVGMRSRVAPAPAAVPVAKTTGDGVAVVDQRNVEDLLKYINGESGGAGGTPKKKKTANPKARR